MIFKAIYATVAVIAFAGIARAQCQSSSCSLLNLRSKTTIRQQTATTVAAPVQVVTVATAVQTRSTSQSVKTRQRVRLVRR